MYDISEYISKSTIIKYRDNGLTEKSIQMYFNKRRINLQKGFLTMCAPVKKHSL